MFHPPAPPPHHLPPPPHYAPPPSHAGPSQPRPHYYPHTPPSAPPHSRHHHYPHTPSPLTPRLHHVAPSPINVTPRSYHPPPTHHVPRAGPSQVNRTLLPPHPHSAPAKMDYPSTWPYEQASVLELMCGLDQANSPTRSLAQEPKHDLPRISMSTAPSTGSMSTPNFTTPRLMAYPWGPNEGGAGAQLLIKVDVHPDFVHNVGHGNDRLRVVIGDKTLTTTVKNLGSDRCRIPGGSIQILSATIPMNGTTMTYQMYDVSPVYVQQVDARGETVEMLHIGDWTFVGADINPNNNQVMPAYGVKREGEYMEFNRDNQWNEHRRSVSASLSAQYDSGMYTTAPSPQVPQMSQIPPMPWGSQGFTQHMHMMANQQGYDPSFFGMNPCPQPALTRSTQLGPHANYYDAPKADIYIAGDMNTMAKGWQSDEWAAKRRLVKVWRRQEGHSIYLAFCAMTQAQWQNEKDCVVVSCMFREDKNSCWITSVDMLYLLEAVIGQRFSVEEKNRIRRNLEGFRPQTVSKNKQTSDAFFRTIMNYPNPKPRNIEKDVKVFPWEAVSGSIKKIVSKYTATVGPGGEPILYHPPSGEGGSTIPLPRVNEFNGSTGRTVSYDESSVFAGASQDTMQSMPPMSGMSSIAPPFPIDPSLLNMSHPPQSSGMVSMHPGASGSQMFDQTYPHPHSVGMHPNANWNQTIDGYRSCPSPPGLSYSHSSTATALTEYPTSPHGYYPNPTMTGSAPTTSSSNPTGQGPSDQSGSSPRKGTLDVNVSTDQSPSDTFWQNSSYALDPTGTFVAQTYDDYKATMSGDGVGAYPDPVYTDAPLA